MATAPSGKPFVSYLRVPDIKNEDPFTNPQMQFATRNGKLKFREIRSLDIKNIIRTNNISSLEGFAENLIFADIDSENFEDKNFTRLIKTFQYSLEYLNKIHPSGIHSILQEYQKHNYQAIYYLKYL